MQWEGEDYAKWVLLGSAVEFRICTKSGQLSESEGQGQGGTWTDLPFLVP